MNNAYNSVIYKSKTYLNKILIIIIYVVVNIKLSQIKCSTSKNNNNFKVTGGLEKPIVE
jgi:hypothetical protein